MLSIFVALAIGALLGDAFIHLIPEAFKDAENPTIVSLLIIAGILSFFWLEKLLQLHHEHYIDIPGSAKKHHVKPMGRLILISDGFHNFLDGIIIGVGYLAGLEVGIATTLAVILHEIPQEIGDFGVLLHSGYTRSRALFFNFLSALMAVAGVLLGLAAGSTAAQFIDWTLPLAAGLFIYLASSDLVPELHKHRDSNGLQLIAILVGLGAMYLLLFFE